MKAGKWGMAIAAVVFLAMAAPVNADTGVIKIYNGTTYGPFSGSTWGSRIRRIWVPSNVHKLVFETWGGTGDANVYVHYNREPYTYDYKARGILAGNAARVTIWGPASGYWYIKMYGASDYAGLKLRATYSETNIPTIAGGYTYTRSGTYMSRNYMRIWVPAGKSKLVVKTWGGRGDCDLYVKRYSQPSTLVYHTRDYGPGTEETVTITNPTAGYWYIMIYGYSWYDRVYVKATMTTTPTAYQINNNVTYGPRSAVRGNEVYYRIYVGHGAPKLTVRTWGGSGDADVYLKWQDPPTTTSYAVRGYSQVNSETVSVNNPAPGWWYIMLRGYKDYSGLYWKASY